MWDFVYNAVLKFPLYQGSMSIGYMDDTLIVAEGTTVNEVHKRANPGIVSEHIRSLGFCLAIDKTQVVLLTGRQRRR